MFTCCICVAFCQTEIDNVDFITSTLGRPNAEIVRFDIPMDDPLVMNLLEMLCQLYGYLKYRFNFKFLSCAKEIF